LIFDWSHVLPQDSPLGSFLAGILGYQDTPTLSEVIAYLGFLIVALPIFLFGNPTALVRTRPAT
jgi:high-affinity iron transporter